MEKYPTKSWIFISQMNGRGKIKGGTDTSHAVDIKIKCLNGMARVQSRFTEEKTIEIFKRQAKAGEQIPLL